MERFYLITNRAKDPDLTVTDQIRQYLEERGKTCFSAITAKNGVKIPLYGSGEGSVRYRRHSGARW